MMVRNSERSGCAVIQFHEDHFTYDAERRGFYLDEPDTLLGDRITRIDVTAHRHSQGWKQLTTVKLTEGDTLGVIDLWTKSEELDLPES